MTDSEPVPLVNKPKPANPDFTDTASDYLNAKAVDHPQHYNKHPSGIECIDVIEYMPFNIGNAVKYVWRLDDKENDIQDLEKAIWYLQREKEKRLKEQRGE